MLCKPTSHFDHAIRDKVDANSKILSVLNNTTERFSRTY